MPTQLNFSDQLDENVGDFGDCNCNPENVEPDFDLIQIAAYLTTLVCCDTDATVSIRDIEKTGEIFSADKIAFQIETADNPGPGDTVYRVTVEIL